MSLLSKALGFPGNEASVAPGVKFEYSSVFPTSGSTPCLASYGQLDARLCQRSLCRYGMALRTTAGGVRPLSVSGGGQELGTEPLEPLTHQYQPGLGRGFKIHT